MNKCIYKKLNKSFIYICFRADLCEISVNSEYRCKIYINLNIHSPAHFSAPLGYLLSPRVVWLNCPPSAGDDCLARARAPEPRGPLLCGARARSSLKLGFSAQSLASTLSRHFSENGIHESGTPLYVI